MESKLLSNQISLEDLAKYLEGPLVGGSDSQRAFPLNVSINSQEIERGSLFVAIRGQRLDGHCFVDQAKEKGSVCSVVDKVWFDKDYLEGSSGAVIVVEDTLKALQKLAVLFRKQFEGPCIGVTGSSGKTTTKEALNYLLSQQWNGVSNYKNQNNAIGLPLTLLNLSEEQEYVVGELGANHPGEIGALCQILEPNFGIITNVYPCHLEGFGDIEAIYKTKLALAEKVFANNGTMVVFGDDADLVERVRKLKGRFLTFGFSENCDYRITEMTQASDGFLVQVNSEFKFIIRTLARFNVFNVLSALIVASELGLDLNFLCSCLEQFHFPDSRFQEIEGVRGIRIIHDAYNSNPTSLRLAVESLELMKITSRKILVCADMLELGKDEAKLHFQLGQEIAKKNDIHTVVAIGPLMKKFIEGIETDQPCDLDHHYFINNERAVEFLKSFLEKKDLVLFKGSRSTKLEEIIQCFTHGSTH